VKERETEKGGGGWRAGLNGGKRDLLRSERDLLKSKVGLFVTK
jgi:hypothetical protein